MLRFKDVVYECAGDAVLRLLYMQKKFYRNKKCPAIVWIHGGGWTKNCPEAYLPHCQYFARRGVASFSVEYITPGIPVITQYMEYIKSAIRFIRKHAEHFRIDREKIVVIGESAGGQLAISLAINNDIMSVPNLIVNCNGVVDFSGAFKKFVSEYDFPSIESIDEKAKKLSAIHNLSEGMPPILNLQGKKDKTVRPEETIAFHNKYKSYGNISKLVLWEDASHSFILPRYTATKKQIKRAVKEIEIFLQEQGYM